MKKRKSRKITKLDADLDNELDGYEVESSDGGLSEEDRILIENSRGRKTHDDEEEVLRVHESSSDYSDESDNEDAARSNEEEEDEKGLYGGGVSSEMESDIEDKSDNLPDSQAWGSKKKNFYNTDYVDKDYSGFDDEEAAIMEEEEAKAIQQRLLGHLEEADFTMGLLNKVEEQKKDALKLSTKPLQIEGKIELDLSKLSEQELKVFDETETPGFNKFKEESKNFAIYARDVINPILELANERKIRDSLALDFLKTKYLLTLKYCLNFLFFLHLKAKRTSQLMKHPVIKRLSQISKFLYEAEKAEDGGLRKQIMQLVKEITDKKKIATIHSKKDAIPLGKNRKERRKKMLQLLQEREKVEKMIQEKQKKIRFLEEVAGVPLEVSLNQKTECDVSSNEEDIEDDKIDQDEGDKRAVTYQMLKNKGLTPRRKKEVRNPRVRNKNKYRKAIIRRKGQVKLPRKELQKYDGEISGIRKNLSRSIKLK